MNYEQTLNQVLEGDSAAAPDLKLPKTAPEKAKFFLSLNASMRGVPQLLYVSGVTAFGFIQLKQEVRKYVISGGETSELDFIVQSFGGSPDYAYRIIRYLRETFDKVNVIIPFFAKSAASLIALGGSNIYLGDCGELGPLDMQIGTPSENSPSLDFESALTDDFSLRQIEERVLFQYKSLFQYIYTDQSIPINKTELSRQLFSFASDFYQPLLEQINPYNMGKKARILEIGKEYAMKVFAQYHSDFEENKRNQFISYLIDGFPSHGFSVDYYTLNPYLSYVHRPSEVGENFDAIVDLFADLFMNHLGVDLNMIHLQPVPPLPVPAEPPAPGGQDKINTPVTTSEEAKTVSSKKNHSKATTDGPRTAQRTKKSGRKPNTEKVPPNPSGRDPDVHGPAEKGPISTKK